MQQGEILLDVSALSTTVGKAGIPVVKDISFSLRPGRVLGVVGESGSGKSMMANAIMGLLEAPARVTGGSVRFRGQDLVGLSEKALRDLRGNRIAMIFQDPMMTLNPVLSIGTQIAEAVLAHHPVGKKEAWRRGIAALARVGIASPEERMKAYPHEFSGGMRQRVAIAIAIVNDPALIVADEPTTALDVTVQGQILAEVQKLAASTGTAVIWISHDLSVISGLADEIAVMYAGRIVEAGPSGAVLERPTHPYTIGLAGAVPQIGKSGGRLVPIPGSVPSLTDMPKGCAFRTRCPRTTTACLETPALLPISAERSVACHHAGPNQ